MTLMVLAYPKFGQKDLDRIQSLRAKHDLQHYEMLEPHTTLVFPFEGPSEDEVTNHVRAVVKKHPAFRLVLRSAMLIYNHFEPCWHVFLTPDEGLGRLVKLHENFYAGILREKRLLKEPYIPHVTIATSRDCDECKNLAAELNRGDLAIDGVVDAVEVARDFGSRLEMVERIELR